MTPARKAPSDLPGARAQAARHEPRRVAWTPEAKQISDRTGVTGSRSTSIHPPSLDFSWRNVRKPAHCTLTCTLHITGHSATQAQKGPGFRRGPDVEPTFQVDITRNSERCASSGLL